MLDVESILQVYPTPKLDTDVIILDYLFKYVERISQMMRSYRLHIMLKYATDISAT